MIAVPREADSVQVLKRASTLSINRRQLDAALRSKDPIAAYATGSKSIEKIAGKSGAEAIFSGIETLISWRKAQSTLSPSPATSASSSP